MAVNLDGGRLRCGHCVDQLWDDLTHGTLDDHARGCEHCQAALVQFRPLRTATSELAAQHVRPPTDLPGRVIAVVGARRPSASRIPLSGPAGIRLSISERAAAIVLRAAGDTIDGVRARSCRLTPAARDMSTSAGLRLTISIRYGLPALAAARAVRVAVRNAARAQLGLPLGRIDIEVVDIYLARGIWHGSQFCAAEFHGLLCGMCGTLEGMTTSVDFQSPVRLRAVAAADQPAVTPALEELYRGFENQLLVPLWAEIGDLMPPHPRSKAVPHLWRWENLRGLAAKAGELVPVGRGGERRAIALANPGLGGRPFATPTLWAAIQYLMPGEDAPEHRHTQHAFRFVLEGEGVWTVVDGDPVAMRRGDFLPQAGWNWHAHHNATKEPMAWLDGLDIPLQYLTEAQFFEPGRDQLSDAERTTPARSRAERLWGHPGLRPLAAGTPEKPGSPLLAYRWEHTDRALTDQLALEAEGYGGTLEPGHAAVRYTDPATGGDVLPTIRVEMHRIARGTRTEPVRETGSSVYAVFDGSGTVTVGGTTWPVRRGDLFVVPSWQPFSARSEAGATDSGSRALDLFRFSDSPVFEALRLNRRDTAAGAAP